jgi:hypothetical protein
VTDALVGFYPALKGELKMSYTSYTGETFAETLQRVDAQIRNEHKEKQMSFMQRQVIEADYFEVETTQGCWIIPRDVISDAPIGCADIELFINFVEGDPITDEPFVEVQHGWIARMSAPGFLDCTEWAAFKTEKEANDYLDEFYGDNES